VINLSYLLSQFFKGALLLCIRFGVPRTQDTFAVGVPHDFLQAFLRCAKTCEAHMLTSALTTLSVAYSGEEFMDAHAEHDFTFHLHFSRCKSDHSIETSLYNV
jgi:hypothetical protein